MSRAPPRPLCRLLSTLKASEDRLEGLGVLQRGSRLSVMPVTTAQARELLKMAEENDGQ